MKLENQNTLEWLFDRSGGLELKMTIFTTFTLTSSVVYDLLLYTISPGLMCENNEKKRLELANRGVAASEKLLIFSDDCIFKDTALPNRLNKTLDSFFIPNTVCRIKLDESSFFHPKLMIAHFIKEGQDYIRFAVLSKNLTHAGGIIEVCSLFETTMESKEPTVSGSDIVDFINIFLYYAKKSLPKESLSGKTLSADDATNKAKNTLKALGKMKLRLIIPEGQPQPKKVELFFGVPDKHNMLDKLKEDVNNTDQNSFYLCSDSIDDSFTKARNCKYMISNLRSWLKYSDNIPKSAYYFRDSQPRTVHAKFAEFYTGKEHIVWVGSANFTNNAFNNNFECDVRTVYDDTSSVSFSKENNFDKLNRPELMPQPFCVGGINGYIAPVTADALKQVQEEDELIKAVRDLDWTYILEGEKLVIETEKLPNTLAAQFKTAEIYLNKRVALEIQNGRFYAEVYSCKADMIPWYGNATIIIFIDYKTHIDIPVKIECKGNSKTQPLIDATKEDDLQTLQSDLLAGCIPKFIDTIPHLDDVSQWYDKNDSFEARLAKYHVENNDDALLERIQLLTAQAKKVENDTYEDDYEEISYHMYYKEQYRKLNERLKALKEFITGEKT